MDQPGAEPLRVAESLGDLAWVNRYLGVTAAMLRDVERLVGRDGPDSLRVLDVGAGGADILAALGRKRRRRGRGFSGVALDLRGTTLRLAARALARQEDVAGIELVCGDARALPFADRAFHLTVGSTFLHHLEPDDAVAVLREMARVSAVGFVVGDLRRGRLCYLGAWVLSRTLWRWHRYSRHDAPASVRAAYTVPEVRALAVRAGLHPVVERRPLFRWALRWRRPL
jgi:SAM-dependent methyltransferase